MTIFFLLLLDDSTSTFYLFSICGYLLTLSVALKS